MYHSALKRGRLADSTPCHRLVLPGVTAFAWDIFDGWHDDHLHGDALYMDIPWRAGFKVFEDRAGKEYGKRTHRDMLDQINRMLGDWDGIAVLTHGRDVADCLTGCEARFDSSLNGDPCLVSVWNASDSPGGPAEEVLAWLADRATILVDPMCGYGRTGRYAKMRRKPAILSDFNATCIGYIRDAWETW